ncbi:MULTISPECIES: hypothetical protein [Enterobacteriaceae]|uniref:hypothetical protein n=1 Tax=Enterobacteriaceae TaxID=543 RepID=UPI0019CB685E|nr:MULTISPECIES: hypothetical protein [Enterobacteriaceae]HAK2550620.1 hypothetical protein [Salmonella enterica]MCX9376526.1 hypothetical protein [Escherichia coli]UFM72120.1 hypothetical protein LO739_24270 [Leclercia adecarboxylata]WCS70574.1 hypothetical protein [Enterobacter hormaechei]HAK2692364.1 hypothetical protein [Salmonella enterica]
MKPHILIVSLSMILLSANAVAAGNYVDPAQKEIDQKHKALVAKYKKSCSSNSKVSCLLEAKSKASEDVPNRGSVAYSKSQYGSLNKAQAKNKVKELVGLYDKLDGQSSSSWNGKVTQRQIESEIKWIMSYKLNQSMPDIYTAKMYVGASLN